MQAVTASDAATEYIAARRAAAAVLSPWLPMSVRNARLYCAAASSVQNRPISVCAAVRTVLFCSPYVLVRLKFVAQAVLFSGGGGGISARNWSALMSVKGLNCVIHTPTGAGGAFGGGAG